MLRRTFLLCAPLAACVSTAPRTTLIVLRHADRDPEAEDLNPTGEARARALPAALSDYDIDEIWIPDLDRNRQSAAPLADALGLDPQVTTTAAGLGRQLWAAAEGRTLVWIGNAMNLQSLWSELGAPGQPPANYGEIAVLTGTSRGPDRRQDLRFDP